MERFGIWVVAAVESRSDLWEPRETTRSGYHHLSIKLPHVGGQMPQTFGPYLSIPLALIVPETRRNYPYVDFSRI